MRRWNWIGFATAASVALLVSVAARADDAAPAAPATPSADQMAKPAAKAKKAAKPAATPAADATTAADASKKPAAKPKSDKGSVAVSVLNKREVALKSLTAVAAGGGDAKKIIGAVKPGKRGVGHVARTKDCLYDLHGEYDDGSEFEASGVDLCKSSGFNLKD